jgi:hypothetical protein
MQHTAQAHTQNEDNFDTQAQLFDDSAQAKTLVKVAVIQVVCMVLA